MIRDAAFVQILDKTRSQPSFEVLRYLGVGLDMVKVIHVREIEAFADIQEGATERGEYLQTARPTVQVKKVRRYNLKLLSHLGFSQCRHSRFTS